MKKSKKLDASMKIELLGLVCVVVVGLLIAGAIFLLGLDDDPDNATSRALAEHFASRHLSKQYPDFDYEISAIIFDEKTEYYRVKITSEKSADSRFYLVYNAYGKMIRSTYDNDVAAKGNTASRLSAEYQAVVRAALTTMPDCVDHTCYAFLGDIQSNHSDELELDRVYDVTQFGAEQGWIQIRAKVDYAHLVTEQKMAETLLYIRRTLDQSGIPFRFVDCVLDYSYGTYSKSITLEQFEYKDIYDDGLIDRVKECAVIR